MIESPGFTSSPDLPPQAWLNLSCSWLSMRFLGVPGEKVTQGLWGRGWGKAKHQDLGFSGVFSFNILSPCRRLVPLLFFLFFQVSRTASAVGKEWGRKREVEDGTHQLDGSVLTREDILPRAPLVLSLHPQNFIKNLVSFKDPSKQKVSQWKFLPF